MSERLGSDTDVVAESRGGDDEGDADGPLHRLREDVRAGGGRTSADNSFATDDGGKSVEDDGGDDDDDDEKGAREK